MALFGKKKNEEKKTEEVEVVEQEVQEEEEEKVKVVPASTFSSRIGGVFGRMYRLILSCDLQGNVCQVESGVQKIGNTQINVREYYDTIYQASIDACYENDKERFAKDFERQTLAKALSESTSGFSGIYCMSHNAGGDGILEYHFYEIRADRIPDPEGADVERVRCIIYIRQVKDLPRNYGASLAEPDEEDIDWNEIRIRKLLGGKTSFFFEYDVENDQMKLHSETPGGTSTKIINTYLASLEVRSDWTIFHSDLSTVSNLINGAIKGKTASAEIRYRINANKKEPYRVCKLTCAPMEDVYPAKFVVGALTDIDEEAKSRDLRNEYDAQINKLLNSEDAILHELDFDKNLIYKVKKTENGYSRDASPNRITDYVQKKVETKEVHPQDAKVFTDSHKAGFLEKKTIGGRFEFEARTKAVGVDEYRWVNVAFARLGQSNRYLRLTKDINDIHQARTREYELEEQARYVAYNQNMLDTMASLVEFRNVESGAHVSHVRALTRILLEDIVARSPFYDLTKHDIDMYAEASIMHDIGKIVVPDTILNKTGRYTPEEFEVMKKHTTDGARIIEKLDLPGQEELMKYCKEVALHHHERYDGKGYPHGLVGDETPIGVQAAGLADVYDAIVSVRCYKEGLSHEEAVRMILEGECGAFNPRLLESFRICQDKMHSLYI